MRLNEFQNNTTSTEVTNFVKDIMQILGLSSFKSPVIIYDDNFPEKTLGNCSWYIGEKEVEIHINIKVLDFNDEMILFRILAHELCHMAEYLLYWIPTLEKQLKIVHGKVGYEKEKFRDWCNNEIQKASHGPQWQHFADLLNSEVPNFVTKTSDKSYDLTSKQ